MQHKEKGQRSRINYEEGQYVTQLWLPAEEKEVQEETDKFMKAIASLSWRRRVSKFSV